MKQDVVRLLNLFRENLRWLPQLLLMVFCIFGADAQAQMLIERPQSTGGDLVGMWEASEESLKVYVPPQVVAAVSGFNLGGDLSGTITFSSGGTYRVDYITTAKVTVSFLGLPILIDVADTNKADGTYAISSTQLIMTSNTLPALSDTLNFTATSDSLHLVQRVPLQGFETLAAGLVPADDPIVSVLSFSKSADEVQDQGPITADFDGNGSVDFPDFLAFVMHFGSASGQAGYDVAFDLDESGAVDFPDFLSFAKQFGRQSSL